METKQCDKHGFIAEKSLKGSTHGGPFLNLSRISGELAMQATYVTDQPFKLDEWLLREGHCSVVDLKF